MPPDPSHEPFAILAVDDSLDNLFLIESILDDPDYHITCVESGHEALNIVGQTPPDVILLDVMMPGLDGYAVTQRIRDNTNLPYIPILLITAHDQSSLVQGLDAGADDFIASRWMSTSCGPGCDRCCASSAAWTPRTL
jgi:CheY-like chemotaxis protein